MERRSITVDADVHARILNFRAFFLAHGIDIDYTTAINLLAGHGFDELRRLGLDPDLMVRLGKLASLDEAAKEAMPGEWAEWKTPGLEATSEDTTTRESRIRSETQSPPIAHGKTKPVVAYCIKCKKQTEMRGPHEVTAKKGRTAIQGTCPVCGTKMYRMGSMR